MAKKQAIVNETASSGTSARVAKPNAPRVRAAQHSKVVSTEPVISQTVSGNSHEIIAQMAYGFWEARGRQHGAALEDWIRAENEYRLTTAAERN